jgi:hypothetical protein
MRKIRQFLGSEDMEFGDEHPPHHHPHDPHDHRHHHHD